MGFFNDLLVFCFLFYVVLFLNHFFGFCCSCSMLAASFPVGLGCSFSLGLLCRCRLVMFSRVGEAYLFGGWFFRSVYWLLFELVVVWVLYFYFLLVGGLEVSIGVSLCFWCEFVVAH